MLIAYYLTISAIFLASFFPEFRLWGLNQWAFFSVGVRFGFLLIAIIIPIILSATPFSERAQLFLDRSLNYYWFAGIFTAVLALTFFFLTAKTHFLGDGYLILSSLASDNPTVKETAFGAIKTHIWLKALIGGNDEATALLTFRSVSISSGVIFLLFAFILPKKIIDSKLDSALFALGLVSGGWMLLFFGYVEYYALFVLSVAIFCLVGLLILQEKLSRWIILPFFALTIFFHVLGLTLLPAALYLLVAGTKFESAFDRLSKPNKALFFAVLAVIGIAIFTYFYQNSYQFRFVFVPIITDRFTVEGYTLFSLKHILDFISLIIKLVPGILICLALPILSSEGKLPRKVFRYFLILCLATLGTVFLIDPKLGMPRDWDLLSFCGIPLTFAICYRLLTYATPPPPRKSKWQFR